MTKQLISFSFISILFVSCATLGTKTLYKSNTNSGIKKIGFTRLDGDSIISKIFPQTDSIFTRTFVAIFKSYNINDVTSLDNEFSIYNPDTIAIAKICNDNNFDALIVSRLKFIHVTYSMNFIQIAKNWDTEVEMKLFDKSGNLMLTVLHNTTKGNSYFMPPTADRTIHDGTEGAIKRIAKEFRLTK